MGPAASPPGPRRAQPQGPVPARCGRQLFSSRCHCGWRNKRHADDLILEQRDFLFLKGQRQEAGNVAELVPRVLGYFLGGRGQCVDCDTGLNGGRGLAVPCLFL